MARSQAITPIPNASARTKFEFMARDAFQPAEMNFRKCFRFRTARRGRSITLFCFPVGERGFALEIPDRRLSSRRRTQLAPAVRAKAVGFDDLSPALRAGGMQIAFAARAEVESRADCRGALRAGIRQWVAD